MATRRTTAPRKRPAANVAPAAVGETPALDGAEDNAPEFNAQDAARDILNEFEDVLRAERSLSDEDREAFTETLTIAFRDVVASGSYAEIPSDAEWQDMLDEIKRQAADIDGGQAGVAHLIANACAPLEQRQTKVTVEFSRRLQADGQESALAWLREQSASSSAEVGEPVAVPQAHALPALSSEVTQSRSRRLRGPPK